MIEMLLVAVPTLPAIAALARTRPAVEGEHDDSSGLALEERSLFAEAIVRTMA